MVPVHICLSSFSALVSTPHPTLEQKTDLGDLPGGPVVKDPPSNAVDTGLIPGWGTKIPQALGQQSLCCTTKPVVHKD